MSKSKTIRCCRCGSTEFGLSGNEEIFIDFDSILTIICRQCLARQTGTLIDTGHLEFMKEDIDE